VRGRLPTLPAFPLVLVSSAAYSLDAAQAAAHRYPTSHYAFVGGSIGAAKQANLVGVVLRDEQAALLGGIVAGLVVREQGSADGRAAWVGPQENRLAAAFADGVHRIVPNAIVLHGWSKRTPARCKEAALATLVRGAVVVMAHEGLCAQAVAAAAHEQNDVALALTDFELPSVAASLVARDAVAGIFHGGEDLVFGAASGAVGIWQLDPRISGDVALQARAAAQELAGAG
jgi:basic membrane lipoprotein Med (substrate-binding protein (PBP1-ABC) superfamily)